MAESPSRNDSLTIGCPICGQLFEASGRRRYCSDRCRQAAWRERKPQTLGLLPKRTPKLATIYECGICETRQIGDQWCADCQRPCRRVGPGVPCPHCDEPLALDELWPT
ncbi:MAG: hypothetical protein AB7K24_26450 [Gemmataceae bacterium]